MSHCLNPACPKPGNPDNYRFCQSCGWRLRLGDRFEAAYALGSGQSSQTFVGRDRATLVQPQCLIKRFTPRGNTALERAAAAERFRKDVDHWAIASQHPQIPNLLAYFERGSQQFLVQQFLVGAHLDQCLAEKLGPFDSEEVTQFLRDVLPILHHLHQNRIVHRDIKPTNFRRPPGQEHWWLVDLGATKPLTATQLARPGTLIGSADYASPEQLRGEATFASDLYSLGVVGLHLLTGLQPFDLFDSVNGCWQWRSIVPDVSPSLATLLDRLVQPALRDRIPDVVTVMASLGMALPPTPDPESSAAAAKPWTPIDTVELGIAVAAALVLPDLDHLIALTIEGQLAARSLSHPETTLPSLPSQPPYIAAIAAHPTQPAVVAGTRQGRLVGWQWQDDTWHYQELGQGDRPVTQLTFTPDGEFLIVGDDQGQLDLWDWATRHRKQIWKDHDAGISSLAVSSSGTLLASGDAQGRVTLWDVRTGESLRSLSRQQGAITALAWLPNDQVLVTASWDVTLSWRCPQTGGTLQSAKAQGFFLPVRSLLTHPTSTGIVTGSQDGQLQYWGLDSSDQIGGERRPRGTQQAIAIASSLGVPIVTLGSVLSPSAEVPQLLSITATGTWHRWSYPS